MSSEKIVMARVLIGTSGWHYDSWRGPFYPEGLPIKAQLQYYASQFETAELNGVFYRTPTPDAVRSWKEQTGKDFVFTWKASKFITHWKRLSANSVNSLELMERSSVVAWRQGRLRYFFNCHPTFKQTRIAYLPFSGCCRRKDATVSNSGTRVGMRQGSCAYLRRQISRFAFPTTMTRRRLGNGRRTLSTFEVMVRAVATRGTIRRAPWRIGPSASSHGNRRGATCLCSSITIRRALHRSMLSS